MRAVCVYTHRLQRKRGKTGLSSFLADNQARGYGSESLDVDALVVDWLHCRRPHIGEVNEEEI